LNVAKETLQKEPIKCKNWITVDIFQLIKKKREAKTKSPDQYRKLRGEVQKSLRRDKQAELDALCSELEENALKGNSRPVFQTVKKLTKPFQPRTIAIRDSTGKKLTDPEKVCQRWKEYCEELYDGKEEPRTYQLMFKKTTSFKRGS